MTFNKAVPLVYSIAGASVPEVLNMYFDILEETLGVMTYSIDLCTSSIVMRQSCH